MYFNKCIPKKNNGFLTSHLGESSLNKTGRGLLCITHPVAADRHDIIIQPLPMWKHGVTAERQTERGTCVMSY